MRALAIALLAATAATLLLPAASAAVTTPEELCRPGEGGLCHWYTQEGDQCAFAHLATYFVGACTTSGSPPILLCAKAELGLWDGWCGTPSLP